MGYRINTARKRRLGLVGLLGAIVLACGSDDGDSATTDNGVVSDASGDADTDAATDDEGGGDTSDDADADGADSGDDATDDDAESATVLAASDGWSEVDDVNLPAGTGELTIDGETYPFEADCRGFGEVPDHAMDHALQLNEYLLFTLAMTGTGVTEDGGNYRLVVDRSIHIAGDRYLNLQHAGYGGDGQIDVVSFSPPTEGVARLQTPSSSDPDGDLLPLVRVDPSGAIRAEGEWEVEFEGDVAPEGAFTLEARCQDGWPDDIIDAAR